LAPQIATLLIGALVLQGCMVGPNYKAPKLPVPNNFRNAVVDNATSLGDLQWTDLFQDPTLQGLVTEALRNNYDVRIAAQRILEARAQVTVATSSLLPVVSGRGGITNREIATGGGTPLPPGIQREVTFGNSLLDMTFQLDFWGRYRRLTEAARNDFLGQEAVRRTVISRCWPMWRPIIFN
jgi:multidrug efflux system outer membrane protein